MRFEYEYTDTFSGEANYSWVERGEVDMPELTHYGYDGQQGYEKANRSMERELVKKVKANLGITGVRCKREVYGESITLRPYKSNTIIFINFVEGE